MRTPGAFFGQEIVGQLAGRCRIGSGGVWDAFLSIIGAHSQGLSHVLQPTVIERCSLRLRIILRKRVLYDVHVWHRLLSATVAVPPMVSTPPISKAKSIRTSLMRSSRPCTSCPSDLPRPQDVAPPHQLVSRSRPRALRARSEQSRPSRSAYRMRRWQSPRRLRWSRSWRSGWAREGRPG